MASPDDAEGRRELPDRKSTRLNSSHLGISYAVFCLKKTTRVPSRSLKNHSSALTSPRHGGEGPEFHSCRQAVKNVPALQRFFFYFCGRLEYFHSSQTRGSTL